MAQPYVSSTDVVVTSPGGELSPLRGRRFVVALAALAACAAGFFGAAYLPAEPWQEGMDAFYAAGCALALLIAWAGVWRRSLDRSMLAAIALGVGLTFTVAGEYAFQYYNYVVGEMPASPTAYDFMWIAGLLMQLAALVMLPTRPLSWTLRGRIAADGLLTVLGTLTLLWYYRVAPAIDETYGSVPERFFSISMPTLSALVLSCAILLGGHVSVPRVRWATRALIASAALSATGDLLWANLELSGGSTTSSPWMFVYIVGYCLMGASVPLLRSVPTEHLRALGADAQPKPSMLRLLLPYVLITAIVGLSVFELQQPSSRLATGGLLVGCAAMLVLVLLRQLLAIRENVRLYDQLHGAYGRLESLATTDGMTGLANHRAFQDRLAEQVQLATRHGRALSLALIDVDQFKAYNDSFGHPAGDDVLKRVAQVLRQTCRISDVPARYGGEEFVVILPESDPTQAALAAERLRDAVERATFPNRAITISIGVATLGPAAPAPDRLIDAADRALYHSKRAGRNRATHVDALARKAA
jgi:diguanylate cyclase (GGDEF)-like protein